MATQAELEQVRRALNKLSSSAQNDMAAVWASLPAGDRALMGRALAQGWEWVLERYGNMASTLAADFFEVSAADLGVKRPKAILAAAMNDREAMSSLGWALSTENQQGNVMVLLDKLVKQPYRQTMQESAHANGLAWARVPSGSETCAFCLMLASRGAVYKTKESAKFGSSGGKFHGFCDCQPVLVRGPEDYPEGYDPDALYDQYDAAKTSAGYGPDVPLSYTNPRQESTQDMKNVVAQLRAQQGIN